MNGFFTKKDNDQKVIVLSGDGKERTKKAIISKFIDEKKKKEEDEKKYLNGLHETKELLDPEKIQNTGTNFINDVEIEKIFYDIGNKTLVFFDTETTGLETDADIIEISVLIRKSGENKYESGSSLFKTNKKISIGAKMKSGITEDMIQDKEYFKDSSYYKLFEKLSQDDNVIFIAHNIEFDRGMLENQGIYLKKENCICTFKLVKILFPEAESHSLVGLKYCYPMILQASRRMGLKQEEHRAGYDTDMLMLTFNFIINYIQNNDKFSTKEIDKILLRMIELTNSIIKMKYIPFGKYKGEDFEDIYYKDKEYLEYLYITEKQKLKEERPNLDLIYTIENIFISHKSTINIKR